MWEETDIRNKKIVYETYCQDNIYITDYSLGVSKDCYIFFSGNGLYYPNTQDEFIQKIVYEDRYEWRNLCKTRSFKKNAKKVIFVRDIYKQWYVTGCSKKLNTIDKMYLYLKNITTGYDIITVGNSAGGYAAVLFGILLKAKCIYSFSGQFSIFDKINNENILVQDNKQRQYYNLRNLIEENKGNIPVFWFYAVKSDYDIEQRKIIDELPIYKIAFDESIHGKSCFPTDCIPFILKTKDNLNLQYVLKSKVYNNISFSYKLFGITGIIRAIAHVIRKKKALFVK